MQKTFSNVFEIILNNKYLKALFLTFLFILFIGLFTIITVLAFEIPVIGMLLIFVIVYFFDIKRFIIKERKYVNEKNISNNKFKKT